MSIISGDLCTRFSVLTAGPYRVFCECRFFAKYPRISKFISLKEKKFLTRKIVCPRAKRYKKSDFFSSSPIFFLCNNPRRRFDLIFKPLSVYRPSIWKSHFSSFFLLIFSLVFGKNAPWNFWNKKSQYFILVGSVGHAPNPIRKKFYEINFAFCSRKFIKNKR